MADDKLAPLITACPNCDMRFRVTESQLQVAKGKVRCGACLHVFDGTSQLVQDGEALGGAEIEDVDELLAEIDGEIDDRASADPFPADEVGEDAEPERALTQPEEALESDLLERVESDSETRLKALEDELMADLKGVLSTSESSQEPFADRTIEARQERAEVVGTPVTAAATELSGSEATRSEINSDSGHLEIELTIAEPEPPPVQEIPADLLHDDEVPKRGWGTWAAMVLALIALPMQVLWFQYDEWVKDDSIRPVYAFVCELAGCELPVRRNVGLIVAKNSVLRDHPDQDEALIYDALLVNHARYAQPFPFVELTLTTMGGHLVATRRFKPDEYLAGEAADAAFMQPRTPIHISLELKNPGEEPLNFRIRFLPTG